MKAIFEFISIIDCRYVSIDFNKQAREHGIEFGSLHSIGRTMTPEIGSDKWFVFCSIPKLLLLNYKEQL